jgi:hypothetical protein
METRADRAPRQAEKLGDDGGLISDVMAKHEDRALFRTQPAERTVHDVTVDHAGELVARDMLGDVEDL